MKTNVSLKKSMSDTLKFITKWRVLSENNVSCIKSTKFNNCGIENM
jgi:hypothetical protein